MENYILYHKDFELFKEALDYYFETFPVIPEEHQEESAKRLLEFCRLAVNKGIVWTLEVRGQGSYYDK